MHDNLGSIPGADPFDPAVLDVPFEDIPFAITTNPRVTFTPDPSLNLTTHLQEHVINGQTKVGSNGQPTATGAHFANSPNVEVDFSRAVYDPSGNGVFVAPVKVRTTTGGRILAGGVA